MFCCIVARAIFRPPGAGGRRFDRMAFRKRKKKRGKNPIVRASTALSTDETDVGEPVTKSLAAKATETGSPSGNEIDEAGGLFFKSVQNKRRKHQALKKKGLFSSSNRVVTTRLKQQKKAELKTKTESVAKVPRQKSEPGKMETSSKTSDRSHSNGIQSKSIDDNISVGMTNIGSTALSLDDTLKILRRSIEHRKKKCSQVERKLMEIEVDEKGLSEEIGKVEASHESLTEKSTFFAQYKSMVLNAVQSYKNIVSKIDQMYGVQDAIWSDQFQACIINAVKSDDPSSTGAKNSLPLPPAEKLYASRKSFLLQAASTIDALFIKPFEQICGVKMFFEEWKNKYPLEYKQAYAEMSKVDFCIPLIKKDLLRFDPMVSPSDMTNSVYCLETREWFQEFSFDSKALEKILNSCLVPRIYVHLNLINESDLHLKPLDNKNVANYILQIKRNVQLVEKYCKGSMQSKKGAIDNSIKLQFGVFNERFGTQ